MNIIIGEKLLMKITKQGWYVENIGSFRRFEKSLLIFVPILIILFAILIYTQSKILVNNILVTISNTSDYFSSKEAYRAHSKLLWDYAKIEMIVITTNLYFSLFWGILSYFSFLSLKFIGNAIYHLFFPDSRFYNSLKIKYNKYFTKTFVKRLIVPYTVIMIFVIIIFISGNIREKPPLESVEFVLKIIMFLVPVIYVIVWREYLKIRNTRKTKKALNNFSIFLFSKKSISERFKNILFTIFFFAFLGWTLLPFLSNTSQVIGNIGEYYLNHQMDYESNYYLIEKDGYLDNILREDSDVIKLPKPNELKSVLNYFNKSITKNFDLQKIFFKFQQGIFSVIILAVVCEIMFPSILNLIFFRKERKNFITILSLSLQTIFFTFFLQIFIKKAFFIDISNEIGIGPLFMFVLTFVLMINSVQPKKDQ